MYWIRCQPSRATALPAFLCHCRRCISQWEKQKSRCCNPFPLSLQQCPLHQEGFQSFSSQTSFLEILRFSHSFLSLVLTSRGSTSVGAGETLAYLSVLLGLLMMQEPEQQQLRHSGGAGEQGATLTGPPWLWEKKMLPLFPAPGFHVCKVVTEDWCPRQWREGHLLAVPLLAVVDLSCLHFSHCWQFISPRKCQIGKFDCGLYNLFSLPFVLFL